MDHVIPVFDIQENTYQLSKEIVQSSEDLLEYRKSSFPEALADVIAELIVALDDVFQQDFQPDPEPPVLSPVRNLQFRDRLYSHLSRIYGSTPSEEDVSQPPKKSAFSSFVRLILFIASCMLAIMAFL